MKKLILILTGFFLLSLNFAAIADIVPDYETYKIAQFTQTYYMHPTPEQIPDMLSTLDYFGVLQDKYARDPIIAFLAEIIKKDPNVINELAKKIDLKSEIQKLTFYESIWNSNSKAGNLYLKHLSKTTDQKTSTLINAIMTKPPANILQNKLTPEVLDKLWGAFFATGDKIFIKRISLGLTYVKIQRPSKLREALSDVIDNLGLSFTTNEQRVFQAAGWSLSSNAYQTPKLLSIYKEIAAETSGQEQKLLLMIVKNTENQLNEDKKLEKKLIQQAKINHKKTRQVAMYYLKRQKMQEYIKWLKKSAQQGDAESQSDLGFYYAKGWYGIKRDFSQANFWLNKAAKVKNPSALQRLGQNYLHGDGVKKDPKKAFHYFEQAAAKNDFCGLYMVGKFYTKGIVVEKNDATAQQWLLLSARKFLDQNPEKGFDNMQEVIKIFPTYYTLKNQNKNISNIYGVDQKTIREAQLLTKYFEYICK